MNFINKKYLIISVILLINIANGANANTIIFKINDLIYTSEDLEKRISYIKLKDKTLNIDKDKIKKEYINSLIFNELGKKKVTLDEALIISYYNQFFDQYNDININNLLYPVYLSITYKEILINLKIDIIRKIILEDLLNTNDKAKNKILNKVGIADIYEKFFKYFSFNKENFDLVKKNKINIDFQNIKKTINLLNINNIKYIYENKKIFKIEDTINEIQESFNSGNEFVEFNIEDNKIIGQVIKKIKFEKEINYDLIKLELTDNDLNYNNLKCEQILNNNNFNYSELNSLKFSSLNTKIKENLIRVNDKIILNESNKQFIIMLCSITYDENFFQNYKINSQVNLIVTEIENEFIKKYSTIYNLEIYNE